MIELTQTGIAEDGTPIFERVPSPFDDYVTDDDPVRGVAATEMLERQRAWFEAHVDLPPTATVVVGMTRAHPVGVGALLNALKQES